MKQKRSRLFVPAIIIAAVWIIGTAAVGFGWTVPERWDLGLLAIASVMAVFMLTGAATYPGSYPWEDGRHE